MNKTRIRTGNHKKVLFFASIIIFAGIGITIISLTKAASPTASIQPEVGSLSRPEIKVDNATASNAAAVKFSPAAQTTAMNIYYGSTHNHTGCCNDHGEDSTTPADIFSLAKQYNFNWLFLTEHTNPRSVGDPVTQAAMSNNPTNWFNSVKSQAVSTSTASFVGFAGVETGDPGSNHMTIVNQDSFFFAEQPADNINYVVSQRDGGNQLALGGFNHPGANGHGGSSTSNITTKSRQAVAFSGVHSGTTSSSRDVTSGLGSYIVHLDRGWRVGPSCELDGHGKFRLAEWGEARADTCRNGVLAPSLTRSNLNDAFSNRRFYTVRDTNTQIRYKANGQWMGSIIGKPSSINFEIDVSDPDTSNANDKIKKIEIISVGGAVVASQTFDAHSVSWDPVVPVNNRKYFFLKIYNGSLTYHMGVTAPVWVE
ncbi:MAG: hypothetical protein QG628_713 [Patescibacteria group bacterium]|jgi:hypothetical protein|nr:hypothetical protein [Patescibacteria group bacterium]